MNRDRLLAAVTEALELVGEPSALARAVVGGRVPWLRKKIIRSLLAAADPAAHAAARELEPQP